MPDKGPIYLDGKRVPFAAVVRETEVARDRGDEVTLVRPGFHLGKDRPVRRVHFGETNFWFGCTHAINRSAPGGSCPDRRRPLSVSTSYATCAGRLLPLLRKSREVGGTTSRTTIATLARPVSMPTQADGAGGSALNPPSETAIDINPSNP